MSNENAPSGPQPADSGAATFRAELPADLTSPSRARQAIRDALAAWAIDDPDGDGELLASELVTNALQHAPGASVGMAVRLESTNGQSRGITCEVTDSSPSLPAARQARPDQEHGRGMAIVQALAAATGARVGQAGKTTWFTLALHDRINRIARQEDAEPEAGG